jgi:TPR repeat protein
MLAPMKRRFLAAGALAVLAGGAARAQFYDLDRTYGCVMAPDKGCARGLAEQPPGAVTPPKRTPVVPGLGDAIADVEKRAPTAADMRLIKRHAAAKDPRAVEVLAWCALSGIGMPADPVAAYWLYGEAADLGVANARRNQIAVFETWLTSQQRQQVLIKENH